MPDCIIANGYRSCIEEVCLKLDPMNELHVKDATARILHRHVDLSR